MKDFYEAGTTQPLRAHLRAGTSLIHNRLDRSVARLDLLDPAQYARFLMRQLDARHAIEQWAGQHCPAPLRPPPMAGALRGDLADLAHLSSAEPPRDAPPVLFALPVGSDLLGLAWAIAGSHLGNRAMLARLTAAAERSGAGTLPRRFLADTRMARFWRLLLPRLREPVDAARAEPALAAARAVFARFELAFARVEPPRRHAA